MSKIICGKYTAIPGAIWHWSLVSPKRPPISLSELRRPLETWEEEKSGAPKCLHTSIQKTAANSMGRVWLMHRLCYALADCEYEDGVHESEGYGIERVYESEGYGNERVQESAFVVKAKHIDVALAFPSSTCPHRKLELPLEQRKLLRRTGRR